MNTMTRHISIIISTILLVFSFVAHGADLYHQEVNIKAKDGKNLLMVLDEVESYDKFSVIKVKHTSGASVPSIMFLVKGFYEIAKLRGTDYFINLKEWIDEEGNWVYKIGFSSDNSVNPAAYFGDDIDQSKDLKFMSVKDYDLFGGG
jgi:hypothetical protein